MIRDATTTTIVGRAGTNPQVSLGSTGDRVSFRVVSTDRRFDRETGGWVDGEECWLTVVCWQGLAKAVMSTIRKGDPIVVIGRINNRRFEKNGVTQYFTDVKADLVGLDTARLGSRFARTIAEPAHAEEHPATEVGTSDAAVDERAGTTDTGDVWPDRSDDDPAPWESDRGSDGAPVEDQAAVLTPAG